MKEARKNYESSVDKQKKKRRKIWIRKSRKMEVLFQNYKKHLIKTKKKTEKCDNEYKVSVSNLAQAQDKFYDNDMPMLLKEFEIHDEKRIGLTKEYFIELCNIQSPLGPQVTSSTERLLESFQKIDAKADINLYVDSNRPQGERPRATYEGGLSSPSSSTTTNNTAPPPVKVKKEKDETKKEKK